MPDNTLTLDIHGDVSLETFAGAVVHFRGVVDALTREAATGANIRWLIDELHAGSATMTVRAEGEIDAVPRIADDYIELARASERGELAAYPRRVRDEMSALVGIVNGEVDFIRFETAKEDATVTAGASRRVIRALETKAAAAYGGVQGRIQTLTSRHGLRFTLYDTLYDKAVSCYLTEGQEEIMRDVWGQMAVVEGVVTRDPTTGRPLTIREVRNVTSVREVAPAAYLSARGVVKRAMDDEREPEELISAARDV